MRRVHILTEIQKVTQVKPFDTSLCTSTLVVLLSLIGGCGFESGIAQDLSPAVTIESEGMDALHDALVSKISSADNGTMTGPGLIAGMGGARVKLLKSGTQSVMMPLPQMTGGQVPICYFIRSMPSEAAIEYQLQRREKLNDVVSVSLTGNRGQEIRLEWSSVILVAGNVVSPNKEKADSYRHATACVQSESPEVQRIAEKLWPESERVEEYVRRIQQFVREMNMTKRPRSLDALGILDSGMNGICTANSNLAAALLRAKGIGARSMAVIPPTSQRLEMHRIVEYDDNGQWQWFDPSSLHADVPMRPFQTMIVAKTTVADEDLAMKPRMGSMLGCPYGQELEMLSSGVTLWGQDFFWTTAKPLSEFDPNEEATSLAIEAWSRFLRKGKLGAEQTAAADATSLTEFVNALKPAERTDNGIEVP